MRHEPYSLPAGFQWDTLNLDDPIVVNILVFYCFRKQILHYVFTVIPAKGPSIYYVSKRTGWVGIRNDQFF